MLEINDKSEIKSSEKEKAVLEDIIEDDLVGTSGGSGGKIIEETTSMIESRRSNKVSTLPQRFSPSGNYLLTDSREPLCYLEALQIHDEA